MKVQVDTLDAIPSKRIFLSIIADYDLNRSICELVDNAFDKWTRLGRTAPIAVDIWLDEAARMICVEDNAGGLPRDEISYIVGPGLSSSEEADETIGIFGVGTKRAVVALAKEVRIATRYSNGPTYQVEFDDDWLKDEDWRLPLFEVGALAPGTTRVELYNLRVPAIGEEQERMLRHHLSATYARFLENDHVTLRLNGTPIVPRYFDNWSFPPDYLPRHYHGSLRAPNGSMVQVDVLAGLSNESSPTTGEYGVYFYCNDRLVAPAMKTFEVGFTKGQAGQPHPKVSLTKVIVSLHGEAGQMPWNSSKSDISTKHHIFVALHDWLVTVVKDYAAVSRAWEGLWPDKVFRHDKGEIVDTPISDFLTAKRSFLPDPPRSKPRLAERVAKRNQHLVDVKPWTAGLYEGVIAAQTIAKQPFVQANWLAFNILEFTLVTALKDYLVHETAFDAGEADLQNILSELGAFSLRSHVPLDEAIWTQITQFRKRRADLFYARATPSIGDRELRQVDALVDTVLKKLFAVETSA
ncbi:ATP-binding protein [Mesorhizobium caraganae]|uniref:ATP-binding protein n=1 Tax=Mesorhizobium caraganae TaxID=483206 RepID=UPI003ECC79F8